MSKSFMLYTTHKLNTIENIFKRLCVKSLLVITARVWWFICVGFVVVK